MINELKNYIRRHLKPELKERPPAAAYDIWAENYDQQPGNLMLDLDELMFTKLLKNVPLTNKQVADIGCGTGRHWDKILRQEPLNLIGFDVSAGMLKRLQEKFPEARTQRITDNAFIAIPDHSFDVIISTLTVAHIQDIEQALTAWSRILKANGEIIITDFHPATLASGGKRTFTHNNSLIAVQNFVHHTNAIREILFKNNFSLAVQDEIVIDESFKHYYENKNALHVYEHYKGFPILYGLHFKR